MDVLGTVASYLAQFPRDHDPRADGRAGTGRCGLAAVAVATLAWGGCGGSEAPTGPETVPTVPDTDDSETDDTDVADTGGPCLDGTPEIRFGPSVLPRSSFSAYVPGDDVVFAHGASGGYFAELALWTRHAPRLLTVRLDVVDRETGTRLLDRTDGLLEQNLIFDRDVSTPGCEGLLRRLWVPLHHPDAQDSVEPWRWLADRLVTLRVELRGPRRWFIAREALDVVLRPDICILDLYAPGCPCDPLAPRRPSWCDVP